MEDLLERVHGIVHLLGVKEKEKDHVLHYRGSENPITMCGRYEKNILFGFCIYLD